MFFQWDVTPISPPPTECEKCRFEADCYDIKVFLRRSDYPCFRELWQDDPEKARAKLAHWRRRVKAKVSRARKEV